MFIMTFNSIFYIFKMVGLGYHSVYQFYQIYVSILNLGFCLVMTFAISVSANFALMITKLLLKKKIFRIIFISFAVTMIVLTWALNILLTVRMSKWEVTGLSNRTVNLYNLVVCGIVFSFLVISSSVVIVQTLYLRSKTVDSSNQKEKRFWIFFFFNFYFYFSIKDWGIWLFLSRFFVMHLGYYFISLWQLLWSVTISSTISTPVWFYFFSLVSDLQSCSFLQTWCLLSTTKNMENSKSQND